MTINIIIHSLRMFINNVLYSYGLIGEGDCGDDISGSLIRSVEFPVLMIIIIS